MSVTILPTGLGWGERPIELSTPAGIVHVVKKTGARRAKLRLKLDIDHSYTDSSAQHKREDEQDARMAASWGLDQQIFGAVRRGDVTDRPLHFALPFTVPTVATVMGKTFPGRDTEVESWNREYLANIRWRETQVNAFPGVDETLQTIRDTYGRDLRIAFITDCDVWLGYLRTLLAQHSRRQTHGSLLRHFDTYIGLQEVCPPEVEDAYPDAVEESRNWLREIWDEGRAHLGNASLIIALPRQGAKPSSIGAEIALAQTDSDLGTKIVVVDDKHSKGGRVVQGLVQAGYKNSQFVHAVISSDYQRVTPDAPPIHASIGDFAELTGVLEYAFG